jgi:hypothetical protein
MRLVKKTSHGRPLPKQTARVHEVIGWGSRQLQGMSDKVAIPNLLDNKEVFLHACATVAFALRAVADAVRTRTEKLPYYRVHSVSTLASSQQAE